MATVEKRHREAALACEFEFPETEGAFSSWVRTGEWDFHPTLGLRKRLERVAQALANAEQPAPSAPAEYERGLRDGAANERRAVLAHIDSLHSSRAWDFVRSIRNGEHLDDEAPAEFDPWEALAERWAQLQHNVSFHQRDAVIPKSVWAAGKQGAGWTFREAALDLCRKLGLTSADQAKGDADG